MNPKTPAELQLEVLKKLKEQRGSKPPRPSRSAAPAKAAGLLSLEPRRVRSGRRIPLSEAAWSKLKEGALAPGTLKINHELGDWVVELLLGLPSELRSLAPEAKQEFFEKVKAWAASRWVK
jgi:hypothetical protein